MEEGSDGGKGVREGSKKGNGGITDQMSE